MEMEYEFRVWYIDSKIMEYGLENSIMLGTEFKNPYSIVMQYTGLKDKNGKKIYLGDIIKVSDPSREYRVQQVVFDEGSFCGYGEKKTCKNTYLDVLIKAYSVEVIGNIHNDKELLGAN